MGAVSALESPSIDCKLIADHDTFRVTADGPGVVVKLDLRTTAIVSLIEECVEALLAEAEAQEGCITCRENAPDDKTCELLQLHRTIGNYLRRRHGEKSK